MSKLNSILKSLLVLVLIVSASLLTYHARRLMLLAEATAGEIRDAAGEVKATTAVARGYVQKQVDVLESPRMQKSLEAGVEVAAAAKGTIRLINTQTIPRVNRAIDSLRVSSDSLGTLVANTDESINRNLLPGVTEAAKAWGTTPEKVNALVEEITRDSAITFVEIADILRSPDWKQALANVNVATANVAAITSELDRSAANIADATAQMPDIAASLNKISRTSAKYQKALILAQLLSTLVRAF